MPRWMLPVLRPKSPAPVKPSVMTDRLCPSRHTVTHSQAGGFHGPCRAGYRIVFPLRGRSFILTTHLSRPALSAQTPLVFDIGYSLSSFESLFCLRLVPLWVGKGKPATSMMVCTASGRVRFGLSSSKGAKLHPCPPMPPGIGLIQKMPIQAMKRYYFILTFRCALRFSSLFLKQFRSPCVFLRGVAFERTRTNTPLLIERGVFPVFRKREGIWQRYKGSRPCNTNQGQARQIQAENRSPKHPLGGFPGATKQCKRYRMPIPIENPAELAFRHRPVQVPWLQMRL